MFCSLQLYALAWGLRMLTQPVIASHLTFSVGVVEISSNALLEIHLLF
jgi:hypothetical protein